MLHSRVRFVLVIRDKTGSEVAREDLHDFAPCYEDLLFAGVSGGTLSNDGALPSGVVEPAWADGDRGGLAGVNVRLGPLRKRYGPSIATDQALMILAEQKLLDDAASELSRFRWWLEAAPVDEQVAPPRRLRARLSRQPYPFADTTLLALGVTERPAEHDPVAICLRRELVETLQAETASTLERERADILTGHLVREPGGLVAVVVTDRIPAVTATEASRTHFAFSPLTFAAAREEVARRTDGATIVGWHHTHPPPCARECLLLVPPCRTSTLFFSAPHDRIVHRASFGAAYMIALVTGKERERRADQPGLRVWGWRDAAIVERAFTVF